MKVTIDSIKLLNPCKDGLDNLIKHYGDYKGTMSDFLALEHIPYGDKIWLATRVVDSSILQQWSVDCAESVVHIYNEAYPNDSRITDCIEATKRYLVGECGSEELEAARSAAWAAEAASAEAAAAAWSAEAAASARAATRSAAAAWAAAAWAAAAAAAAAAAGESQQEDINISLLIALL